MIRYWCSACILVIPFLVAYAFHSSEWLGWPALFVGVFYWLGCAKYLVDSQ